MTFDYRWLYTWQQMSRTLDNTTGDLPKSYSNGGTLWGSEELQSDSEQDEYGALRSVVYGVIRLRNFPSVSAKDRLTGGRFGLTYVIDGVRPDFVNNDTICDVHTLETS